MNRGINIVESLQGFMTSFRQFEKKLDKLQEDLVTQGNTLNELKAIVSRLGRPSSSAGRMSRGFHSSYTQTLAKHPRHAAGDRRPDKPAFVTKTVKSYPDNNKHVAKHKLPQPPKKLSLSLVKQARIHKAETPRKSRKTKQAKLPPMQKISTSRAHKVFK